MTRSQGSATAELTPRHKKPEKTATRASAKGGTATPARTTNPPRRSVDPAPRAAEDSVPEAEFMRAMHEYKLSSGRMFPTWSEVLEVLQGLGYRKAAAARDEAGAAEMMGRLHAAGWCVGDSASATEDGGHLWVVVGRSGKDVLRGEGATQVEAWRSALGQVTAVPA
jgi:hypothetical protein